MTFIKTYKVDSELCEKIIKSYKHSKKIGATIKRNDGMRKDNQIDFAEMDMRNTDLAVEFFDILHTSIDDYIKTLGLQNILGPYYYTNMLIQGYEADNFESYSSWHCEAGNLNNSNRMLIYSLYLNDDFEGGTTDFMFQKHQEKPKQGKLILFPPGYTHVHRGGMVLSGEKIIATGWVFHSPQMEN